MKIDDLEAELVRAESGGIVRVGTMEQAQGVMFLCPRCFIDNGNQPKGVHRVICWSRSRGVPDAMPPLPGRWSLTGTGVHDLTLGVDVGGDPSRPSVDVTGACRAHFHVRSGEVHWA